LSDSAKQIWRLPTGSLSIHLDAPRICQRAIIIAKDGTTVRLLLYYLFFFNLKQI